ncbi:uncharacterized protein LOC129293705 [Prosopis cineraria]|uniref:uncharacterized protein LOC129293705 n=1 Tax=Prosopis cineraria TaxID=364024 RepID=UPI00240FF61A|nr:uncharacterized protein LOC129293705 [Prosopis cineraria]
MALIDTHSNIALLCFSCSWLLLLIMNGQVIHARDMKVLQKPAEERASQISTTTHSFNQPFLDGWYKNNPDEGRNIKNTNQIYLDGRFKNAPEEGKNVKKINQPYLDGWFKNTPEEGKNIKNTQEGENTKNTYQPYLDGWFKNTKEEGKNIKNTDQLYLDGWFKNTQERKNIENTNQPYLGGWLKNIHERKSTESANQPSLDGWYKNNEGKPVKNIIQAYLDGWYKNAQEEGKTAENSDQPYLDGWYENNQEKEESKDTDLNNSKGEPSSKVDHTMAFKALFFTLDDLYVGNVMTLQFPVREYAHFLPRKAADTIPFSTSELPSLLQLFLLSRDSPMGEDMRDILQQCEFPPSKGETKACPTSLESMLEFVRSILGTDVNYHVLTTSYPTASSARLQNYTVLKVSKDIYAPKWAACHPRPYPYAVYYCHYLDIGSKVFRVLLDGQHGERMDALGICHLDTSDMDPNHILFKQLGMKPGDGPLCHFFPILHLLWAPLPPKYTM